MNKVALIKAVSRETGLPMAQCEEVIQSALLHVQDRLAAGQPVKLIGFGNFSAKVRESREARNPRTGEVISVPPRSSVRFRPSKLLLKEIDRRQGVV